MKTKLKTSSENRIKIILKNNNFRNNQNYIISKYKGNKILEIYETSIRDIFSTGIYSNSIDDIIMPSFYKSQIVKNKLYFLEKKYFNKADGLIKKEKNFITGALIFSFIMININILINFTINNFIFTNIFLFILFLAYKKGLLTKLLKYKKDDDDKYGNMNNLSFIKDTNGLYYYNKIKGKQD